MPLPTPFPAPFPTRLSPPITTTPAFSRSQLAHPFPHSTPFTHSSPLSTLATSFCRRAIIHAEQRKCRARRTRSERFLSAHPHHCPAFTRKPGTRPSCQPLRAFRQLLSAVPVLESRFRSCPPFSGAFLLFAIDIHRSQSKESGIKKPRRWAGATGRGDSHDTA